MLEWGLLLVETMKSDWTGAMYEVLGLGGPHQSICSGRIDWAVDLIERSSTTLDPVCNRPELEGAKFESKRYHGIYRWRISIHKRRHITQTTTRSGSWIDRSCLSCLNMGGETNNSGPGRYGDSRSGVTVLFLLCWQGCLNTDFLFSAISFLKISFKIPLL